MTAPSRPEEANLQAIIKSLETQGKRLLEIVYSIVPSTPSSGVAKTETGKGGLDDIIAALNSVSGDLDEAYRVIATEIKPRLGIE